MKTKIISDMTESSQRFIDILKPQLSKILKGSFITVEGETTDEMRKLFDILSGIDAWFFNNAKGMRGIASRIQPSNHNWRTFTIRYKRDSGTKTEYEKRKYSIENNYLYPYLTLQSYLDDDNNIISYALIKTKDLISIVDNHLEKCILRKTGKSQIGQSSFVVVKWDLIIKLKFKILIYENKELKIYN